MKKTLALALAVLMLFAVMAGCGKKAEDPVTSPEDSSAPPAETAEGSVYYLNFKPEQDGRFVGFPSQANDFAA